MNFLNRNFLQSEVRKWLNEGIITQGLADTLAQRYNLDQGREGSNLIIKTIGYLFIALALIVLIGSNWEEIPRSFRMILLLALTFLAHTGGYLHYKNGNENAATGLFFLGNMLFGASIILIAQIYHLGEHMPDGVLAWAAGSLAFALILKQRFLMMQALVLGFIWAGIEFYSYGVSMPFFGLFLLSSAYVLTKDYSPALMFLTLVAFFNFTFQIYYTALVGDSGFNWYSAEISVYPTYFVYIFTFLLIAFYGIFANFYNRYSPVVLSSTLLAGIIYLLINSVIEYYSIAIAPPTFVMVIFYAILAFLAIVAFMQRHFGFLAFCALYFALPWIFNPDLFSYEIQGDRVYFIEFINLISSVTVFLTAIYLIYQSSKTDSSAQLYAGICTMFAIALIRYVNLLGDYIGASILFLIFAVVMLVVAKFRSKKRSAQ